jgi:hypothetical protein
MQGSEVLKTKLLQPREYESQLSSIEDDIPFEKSPETSPKLINDSIEDKL